MIWRTDIQEEFDSNITTISMRNSAKMLVRPLLGMVRKTKIDIDLHEAAVVVVLVDVDVEVLVDVDVEIRVVVSVISVEGSIVVAPSPKMLTR